MEKEMATHSSVLAWRIPVTGEPGGLLSMGLHRVEHNWSDLAYIYIYIIEYYSAIKEVTPAIGDNMDETWGHYVAWNSHMLFFGHFSQVRFFVTPWTTSWLLYNRLLCSWNSPGKNTGVGCHFLLQGIFPTQGFNPGLPHCRWILYQLTHKGIPRILEW